MPAKPTPHNPRWLKDHKPSLAYLFKVVARMAYERYFPSRRMSEDQYMSLQAHAWGTPVWSGLIKAREDLWEPGHDNFIWGMVVYAPTAPPELAYANLPALLRRIDRLAAMDGIELGEDIRPFIAHVKEPRVSMTTVPVPDSLSPGFDCFVADCLFGRKGLPGGFVKQAPIPIVVAKQEPPEDQYVAALHQKYWPSSYVNYWKNTVSRPRTEEDLEFEATQVDGLPPRILDALEHEVLSLCEEKHLANLFLNVGHVSKKDEPNDAATMDDSNHSGDLTFLGVSFQAEEFRRHLQNLMDRLLTPEQLRHVSIHPMPIDEFETTHGWLLDEMMDDE